VTRQDDEVAAEAIVEEERAWLAGLRRELFAGLAGVFAQARSRLTAFAYIGALLAEPGDRRSCWQLAEAAGHVTPRRMQALLAGHAWDWKAALAALQRFILAHLGDAEAIVVLDETAELKKGTMTVGVARQHAGITGQVENCQTVVFAAYVTARGHTLFDFRLYLPKAWCGDSKRREQAHVPEEVEFTTKPALGHCDDHRRGRRRCAVRLGGRRRSVRSQFQAAGSLREEQQGVRARGPGQLRRHLAVRAQGDRGRGVPADPGQRVGDPLVRARLLGPPRLRLGVGRDRLAAAPGADPPQPIRPI
jgi:hypothetical protein